MYGFDNALELLQDALCDIGDDLVEELVNDLMSGDTACSPALSKLADVIRHHACESAAEYVLGGVS
jgi:hypothetical protein